MKINIVFTGGLVSAVFLGLLLSPILGADKNDSLKSSYESAKKDIYSCTYCNLLYCILTNRKQIILSFSYWNLNKLK
jgi:hypothetical protein